MKQPVLLGLLIIAISDSPGADVPIVHRIIQSHTTTTHHPNGTTTSEQLMLTKGDNNQSDDLGLYRQYMWGMRWLKKDMVVGKVRWFLPYVGYVTIVMVSWVSQRIHRTHTQGSLLMFWCLFFLGRMTFLNSNTPCWVCSGSFCWSTRNSKGGSGCMYAIG